MDKIEFPYIDHRISQESMEDAKDNIFVAIYDSYK